MGCTPSIHVNQTGVVYCRESDESNSPRPSAYNTTAFHASQQHALASKGESAATSDPFREEIVLSSTSAVRVSSSGVKSGKRRGSEPLKSGDSSDTSGGGNKAYLVSRCTGAETTQTGRQSMKDIENEFMFGPMRLHQRIMSILMVFSQVDEQSDGFWRAADKLGYGCTIARTTENALETYLNHHQDVVIVDNRNSNNGFDAESLIRSMKASKTSEFTVFVAVDSSSQSEEVEEPSISTSLRAGFTRCYLENPSVSACMNELHSLEIGEVRACLKLQACTTLFMALDNVTDAVEITNSEHEIQYINPAYERLCGYSNEELLGKNSSEFAKSEKNRDTLESINGQMKKGKLWEGTYYTRRKSGETIPYHCKVTPLLGPSGSISQYLYVKSQLPESYGQMANGNMVSFAKRRESIVRAHSVTIEAPITKVINIINAAQENSPLTVAQALDKVLYILQTSELYSPFQHQELSQDDDPMASDLMEGLITNVKRRLSGHDIHKPTSTNQGHAHIPSSPASSLSQIPENILNILNQDSQWDLNVFTLEKLTNNRPLLYLGWKIFTRFNVCGYLGIGEACLVNWLEIIESNYHSKNFYHNSTHAADVLQATAYFLDRNRTKDIFTQQDLVSCLIAAAVHDVDHPARTNAFLINEKHNLAVLYNDQGVLENHHAYMCFKLTHKNQSVNIFKNLSSDDYRAVRQSIIDQVLATDMKQHFEHLSKFTTSITKHLQRIDGDSTVDSDTPEPDTHVAPTDLSSHENKTLIKRMMIKCADISNPLRSIIVCKQWAERIAEEYCEQTDEEKRRGLPVVMAQFDRKMLNIPKCQLAFIKVFISSLFDAWDVYCDVPELMNQLQENYSYWKNQEELKEKEMLQNQEKEGESTLI